MVADFLEAQAWTVLALGADTPAPELINLVESRSAQLVALSTALPGNLLSVTLTCQRLRRLPRPPYVVVGGRAYAGEQGRALAVGADAFADDPQTLLSSWRTDSHRMPHTEVGSYPWQSDTVVNDGHAEFVAVGDALSPPLGWSVQARRQTWLRLPVGSTVVLYTDGLVDRTHNLDDVAVLAVRRNA